MGKYSGSGLRRERTTAFNSKNLSIFDYSDIVAKELIEGGAVVNKLNGKNSTPLSFLGNVDSVTRRVLEEHGGINVNKDNYGQEYPLHSEIVCLNPQEITEDLIQHVNKSDNNGITPLHLAAMMGSTKLTQLLIDRRAIVNAPDRNGPGS